MVIVAVGGGRSGYVVAVGGVGGGIGSRRWYDRRRYVVDVGGAGRWCW